MNKATINRRNFLRTLGVSAATVPFVVGLDSLYAKAAVAGVPKKRFVFMYSPNGNLYYNWRLRVQGPDVERPPALFDVGHCPAGRPADLR